MELVGQILKKNRKIKKLSLLEVSMELKISSEILYNIENDYENNNIDDVFILGHFRSYCSFLELNQNELVDIFKNKLSPKENKKIDIDRPTIDKNVLFSSKVFSLSLIIVIFVSFYFLFIEADKKSREYAIIPDLPEKYESIIEKADLNKLNKKINIDEDNFAKKESAFNVSSAIASTSKVEDIKSVITLKFLEDTWVQLRDENNEIIFSQLMNKNDEYSYELNSNYSITSGNAGHILVIINQRVRGKIGKKGQVVDSLVLSNDFSN